MNYVSDNEKEYPDFLLRTLEFIIRNCFSADPVNQIIIKDPYNLPEKDKKKLIAYLSILFSMDKRTINNFLENNFDQNVYNLRGFKGCHLPKYLRRAADTALMIEFQNFSLIAINATDPKFPAICNVLDITPR